MPENDPATESEQPDQPELPPELQPLRGHNFSFFPPIVHVGHNEWKLVSVSWSEIQVRNAKGSQELWVPRRYLGAVSRVEEPVIILGLQRELEYSAGIVRPHERRVLRMPSTVMGPPKAAPEEIPTPAMIGGVRVEAGTEAKIGKLLAGFVGVLLVVALGLFWAAAPKRVAYEGILQEELQLSSADDYFAVVRKLGQPANDRWRQSTEMQVRALSYPDRKLTVLLMGSERDKARYIGAVNQDWKPVHSVSQANGTNTRPLLDGIPKF